jgi:hypothetical protein
MVPVGRALYAGAWVVWNGLPFAWGAWGIWCVCGVILWVFGLLVGPVVIIGLTIEHFEWLVKTAAWKPRSRLKGPRRF